MNLTVEGRMIKAVLFDLDGVLVEAVDWHFEAFNKALSLFGYPLKKEEHDTDYNGLPTPVKLKKLSNVSSFPISIHPFINELKQKYTLQTIKQKCRPNPEISQMLNDLALRGYSLGLCSNSNRITVETVLSLMGIRDVFDIVLSTNDVQLPKPSPEIYERAFSLFGLEPEACLIVEDSLPGIEAAESSGAHLLKVTGPKDLSFQLIQKAIEKIEPATRKPVSYSKPSQEIEIILPMAGLGMRFSQQGFTEPKPLIPLHEKPMIEWVVENIRPEKTPYHFTFICNETHLKHLDVEKILKRLEPNCTIIPAKETTAGAACTVLLANNRLLSSKPVLVANSDQWINFSIDAFIKDAFERKSDGSILTFQASDKKWSYAKLDPNNDCVVEVAEKNVISSHATVGIYFFKHAFELANGIRSMIFKDIRTNGEFYLCPVYNELISTQKKIRIFEIPSHCMYGLGTPEDLPSFLEKNR